MREEMRKKIIAFSSMICIMSLLVFSAMVSFTLAGSQGSVKLMVSETDIQYGRLKEGPPVVKDVVLRNIGDTMIRIINVRSS